MVFLPRYSRAISSASAVNQAEVKPPCSTSCSVFCRWKNPQRHRHGAWKTYRNYWDRLRTAARIFIHDTVLRNITLEETAQPTAAYPEALQATGLDEVLKLFPEGWIK